MLKAEDLLVGMELKGTVRNVVDFGAFVDIGVKQDGLLHKSQIPHGTLLKVGDIIDLEILKIEPERGRISLGWAKKKSMKRQMGSLEEPVTFYRAYSYATAYS